MIFSNSQKKSNSQLFIKMGVATAVILVAMKLHAAITINFSSPAFGTNQQSDGSPLDSSFTFELGAFDNGFVPTAANTDNWLANWSPVTDPGGTPLAEASAPYGTISTIFGPSEGFGSSVDLDHNNAPFEINQQGYIWGYDSRTGSSEWILMTNSSPTDAWTYGDASGLAFTETWTVGTSQAVLGDVNFDDGATFVSLRTAAVSAPVPEPATSLLAGATLALLCLRRRRA